MQPYGKGDNYYYLSEDYVLDGETIYTAGYYEAVKLIDQSETRIFILSIFHQIVVQRTRHTSIQHLG